MSIRDRIKKVDVEKMDIETVENLSVQLGDKVAKIMKKSIEESNELLNIYGLEVGLTIKPKSTKLEE